MRTQELNFLRSWRKARIAFRTTSFARDESGSFIIFALFLFVVMLFMSGMAVDLMRHEQSRVKVQNTLDGAVLAASSMTQGLDAETIIRDHAEKAGLDPELVHYKSTEIKANGNTVSGREVRAWMTWNSETMFMNMMGIGSLPGAAVGRAQEGATLVEISLVLDVSGSMGRNSKLSNLKVAAKDFVTTILENSGPDRTVISIVPYNHQVYMDDDLRQRLGFTNPTIRINGPQIHPGQLKSFGYRDPDSRCAVFSNADMETRVLSANQGGTPTPAAVFQDDMFNHSGAANIPFETPEQPALWCNDNAPRILPYQNDETTLHNHINSLFAREWTAIDFGMNWGVALLDPSMRQVVTGMVNDGLAPASAAGHPLRYGDPDVKKYVILMTDGVNTYQFDLKEEYKSAASPIYYSPLLATGVNPCDPAGCNYKGAGSVTLPALDIRATEWDGFVVHMPDNPANQRWFVPGDPETKDDDRYLADNMLPLDAQQLPYRDVYKRFRTNDVPEMFFYTAGDEARYDEHYDVVENLAETGDGVANARLQKTCDAAKANAEITVFTVAFEAPVEAQEVLELCATSTGHYFDVDGLEISDAFNAIASQISVLRLTE